MARLLSSIPARQLTLISGSCYSGAFAREGLGAVGQDVTGGDGPVPDEGKDGHSIFAWNLMQVLRSVSSWKPGSTIFTDIQARVRKEFPQTPKYGAVTAVGHQAGGLLI